MAGCNDNGGIADPNHNNIGLELGTVCQSDTALAMSSWRPVGYTSDSLTAGFEHQLRSKGELTCQAHARNTIDGKKVFGQVVSSDGTCSSPGVRVATQSRLRREPTAEAGGSKYLHQWLGAPSELWVQNFDDSSIDRRGAILYKPGLDHYEQVDSAYLVRAGFWEVYRSGAGGPSSV